MKVGRRKFLKLIGASAAGHIFPRAAGRTENAQAHLPGIDIHSRLCELPLGKHICITRDRGITRFYVDGKPGIGINDWDKLDVLLEPGEKGTREAALRVHKAFEQIECPDPSNYGKFITIGTVEEVHTGIWRKSHGE